MSRCLVLAIVGGLVLAPFASADAKGRQASHSPYGASIPVHLNGRGQVVAPAQVGRGDQLIANHSARELIVVARGTFGSRRLVNDLRRNNGPILAGALARDFTVIDTITPHTGVYTAMRPGSYLIAKCHAPEATAADVAAVRVTGSRRGVLVPVAESVVRFRTKNRLAMPNPTYAESALYIDNRGTRAVQIRLYRLARRVTTPQLTAFTARPSWARLKRLPVVRANDLATLAAGRWVSNGGLPARGRYLAVAVPLLPSGHHRPALRPSLVAATRVKS